MQRTCIIGIIHDDVIKWKHFPRNWPFMRGIQRSPVNSPHKGQWREALMFTLICARINGWVNTREAGDLRRYRPHYDVIVMIYRYNIAAMGVWVQRRKYPFYRSVLVYSGVIIMHSTVYFKTRQSTSIFYLHLTGWPQVREAPTAICFQSNWASPETICVG